MPMRSLAQLHRHYLTSRVGTFALCHTVSPALFSTSHFSTPRDEAENVRQQQIEAENWAKQPGSREVLAQPTFKVNHNDLFEDGKPRGHHDQLAVFRPLDSLEAYLKVCFYRLGLRLGARKVVYSYHVITAALCLELCY